MAPLDVPHLYTFHNGDTRPHWVYRLFDSEGALLYIGVTVNLHQRRAQHQRMQPWWDQVASAKLIGPFIGPGSKARAHIVETERIKAERPRFSLPPGEARKASVARSHAAGERCNLWKCNVCRDAGRLSPADAVRS